MYSNPIGHFPWLILATVLLFTPVGEQIEFTIVTFHFYNWHKLPMVELKIDKKTLLSFEEDKENLIDCVNTNFK